MVFSLTKLVKSSLLFLMVLSVAFVFWGCDPMANHYPFSETSDWICDDPYCTLSYSKDDKGSLISIEELTWGDTIIEVDFEFSSDYYCVYPKGSTNHEERLFSGTWNYQNGKLVMLIEEDFIFNSHYAKLIFTPADSDQ